MTEGRVKRRIALWTLAMDVNTWFCGVQAGVARVVGDLTKQPREI